MFGKKQPTPAPSIVYQDAREALAQAQIATSLLRQAMRTYPPMNRYDEFQELQRIMGNTVAALEEMIEAERSVRA